MKFLARFSPMILALALVSSSQLSCSVNDYCLNCENGDGGHGSGDGGMDGNGSNDGGVDAGCIPSGGPELCNDKDDDCNGLVDDNVSDEGGPCDNVAGACAGGIEICDDGELKCNKQPQAEICDGVDNNCSGPIGTGNGVDEGDPGPPPAKNAPEMDPLVGTPQCGNGLDDDSDGVVDDGCPGTGGKCGTDQGECIAGQFHCDPTTGTVRCFGFIDHRNDAEACNAKDDDCDGVVDDNVPSGGNCGPTTNVGACEFGTINCVGGQPTCQGAVFPKFETCNNMDDDCNGSTDEIFNKTTDVRNCGACGNICPTRANANATCTPQGNPAVGTCGFACKPGYKDINGLVADGCEFGPCFPTGTVEECDGQDNNCNGMTDEGLTPPPLCLKGGECGGGYTDPNGSNPLGPAPSAVCSGSGGWTCTYPGTVQFPETLCDTKDNNCDGNVDENQPNKGQSCHEDRENPSTQCGADTVDNDGDGRVNDGCPRGGTGGASGPETLGNCANATDDDGDGLVNDGCPAIAQLGACEGSGTYQCDPLNLNGAAYCAITTPGSAPAANESCDDTDNDCDGKTDEGGANGTLVGQDWVDLGNGRQMMKYEASRPDSTSSSAGSKNTLVCSKSGVQPWTNVKYQDALAACRAVGAQLCSESQWHHACSVVGTAAGYPTYPISFSGTGLYVEAEDYSSTGVGAVSGSAEASCTDSESAGSCGNNTADEDSDGTVNDGCPVVGTAETFTQCQNGIDDDGDNAVNDGCPAVGVDNDNDGFINDGCAFVGTAPETQCHDRVDNDGDGTVNDGCPAFGPSPEASCNEAPAAGGVDDDGDGTINDGCPANGAAEVNCNDGVDDDGDTRINDGCPAAGPAWVPDYTTVGTATNQQFSGISAMEATPNIGAVVSAANAPALAARLDYAVNFTTAGTNNYHVWVRMFTSSTANDAIHVGISLLPPPQVPTNTITVGTTNAWTWVDAGTFSVPQGVRYVSIYMNEDGAKVDRIYLVSGATNPGTGETLATKGNKWAYASAPNTYAPNTCNGHDYRQVAVTSYARANTGIVTVTSASHPFVAGDLVQIQGASNSTLDGTYTVLTANATTFTYQQNSTSAIASANGGTATEARDPTLTTGSLTSCVANTGTGVFDMSGNVREWTLAHSPGENPIRGGASNGTADGISCPLNFTLADDTFFFPNIGFRCCR
ncbi:MAG TPA: MopE-related protein [Kofleriaceae bacterium]|nr:MopE-related protein [Kofleriaceae bacterium]